ncbi:type III secretion system needle filament subunit SctF [Morganella morganii]|uniref:Type III secretion system needle filament subunit SctF n=1 Tax=Morganella morganii TaxID=582 RepID=A0A9Q4CM01_MORMO|nr:type III secretion system needle filament subunit SctF [Morganella morganii]BEP20440.1 type III secretion system needle filament protein PscF [Morganella morganii subsp. sibonii]EGT3624546.1 EscF/YscF/HrpA family type III secretion system needle major subunit [Morganella morganii]EGT3630524.1 EscF/YscF/HrpA family type III secretion system needle major subunit [Morganella morganii]EGT3636008.1 EscF/YscF/HrpA family type III secretion system needle major subunit [Morganella morganii]EJD60376
MPIIFDPTRSGSVLDDILNSLKEQAQTNEKELKDAIESLKTNPDNPALLQELQYRTTKWSLVFNTASSLVKSMKDIMQNILQKI